MSDHCTHVLFSGPYEASITLLTPLPVHEGVLDHIYFTRCFNFGQLRATFVLGGICAVIPGPFLKSFAGKNLGDVSLLNPFIGVSP